MPEPLPPLPACDLLDVFNRFADTEEIAQARIANADYSEHESVCRLRELRRRWARMGVTKHEDWRP